jgi:hypothetical protein
MGNDDVDEDFRESQDKKALNGGAKASRQNGQKSSGNSI